MIFIRTYSLDTCIYTCIATNFIFNSSFFYLKYLRQKIRKAIFFYTSTTQEYGRVVNWPTAIATCQKDD